MLKSLLMSALLLSVSVPGFAQTGGKEAIVTLHSKVTGNQEQPRVMYIVPWAQPGELQLDQEFQHSIADELFMPVDRDEFRRSLNYQSKTRTATQGKDHGNL